MKTHFLHVGKTGGTALQYALSSLNEDQDLLFHKHSVTLSDIPAGEKVVFFLRDPLARFYSAFYSRKRQGRPRYYSPWSEDEKQTFSVFETPTELICAAVDEAQVHHKHAQTAMRTVEHVRDRYSNWFTSTKYLDSRSEDILHIGFQETLDSDFHILRQKLRIPHAVELPTDDIRAHRNPRYSIPRSSDVHHLFNKTWLASDYIIYRHCQDFLAKRVHQSTLEQKK